MKLYPIRAIYHVITNKRVNGSERIDPHWKERLKISNIAKFGSDTS